MSKLKKSAGTILFFFCFLSSYAYIPNRKSIQLKNSTIYLKENEALTEVRAPTQVLIQFKEMPSNAHKEDCKNHGLQLLNYVPNDAFFAIVYPGADISYLNKIAGIGALPAATEWKAAKGFWKSIETTQGSTEILISFYPVVTEDAIRAQLSSYGGMISSASMAVVGIYKVIIPANRIKQLAGWYAVEYIDKVHEPIPLDAETIATEKANNAKAPIAFGGQGLTGENIVVGVGDNTSAIDNIDLKDRVINYNPAPYGFHGVHTSGITGGAGIIDPEGEGMATHATIVNALYSSIWEQTGPYFHAHDMTITNNSYAATVKDCINAGSYDQTAAALDKTALQYNTVTHVFAAGNDGYITCKPYPAGYATISGGYQPAKNNIVVASVDRRYLNEFVTGSAGPMKDGRLKPEMVAVGANVISSVATEEYFVTLGTSMACPQVAGALALLCERYKQINSNTSPRTDVIKTIVLNGCTDVSNPGPDFKNGFGVLNLGRSLQILNNTRFYTDNVSNGGQQTRSVTVPANTAQLKVMLCWHDPAASPAAASALVNDLDIEVQEPSSVVHHPLILDTIPDHITNNATEGVDRLNNCEQVVINNPAAGNYNVSIKGFNVPMGPQDFVVAYDFIPKGISITYPRTGSQVQAEDSIYVYWDASDDNNSFSLEFSNDGGSGWTMLDNNIPATQRYYLWNMPANISSGKCLFRLKRNNTNEQSVTGSFVVNLLPEVKLDGIQCPGYIRINWTGIPGAAAYEVSRKLGSYLMPVDTVTGTNYTFSGLSPDSIYYVAVRPIIDGLGGYRSIAVKRQPNDGNCTGNFSDGDLMISSITSPNSGRKLTSTDIGSNPTLSLAVRNLDDAAADNYKISYSINGGVWQSQNFTTPLAPTAPATVSITGINLSGSNSYTIKTAIQNLAVTDPVNRNDTVSKTIRLLDNNAVDLTAGFTDDFENMPITESRLSFFGISPNQHWDYYNSTDTGRCRSFVNEGITINGNRSISLDAIKNIGGNVNEFRGTFNLANYNAASDEVRAEFSYIVHGKPKFVDSNNVWVRGSDTSAWQKIFQYKTDAISIGNIKKSGTLSVTDALQKDGQNFSTSTQIRFLQNDGSVLALRNYGSGVTIDDVKLYTVKNDVQLVEVKSPLQVECGLTGSVPLTIRIFNSVAQTQNNVQLYYSIDGGTTVNETLPLIAGKDSIDFSFEHKIDMSKTGAHQLNVWLSANGDTYKNNDSILNYSLHNQPLIAMYPFKEDFEKGDGSWYAEGLRNSWQYGTPQGKHTQRAASGTKAWKTSLKGNYNNLEMSYLYSPCFDLSVLEHPYLRFSVSLDLEDCGADLCDAAFMEYSTDGHAWNKLGIAGQGLNWYNDTINNVWSTTDVWRKSGYYLPKASLLRLRYVMQADPGFTKEGIAVDDIEVYDRPVEPVEPNVPRIYPNPSRDGVFTVEWLADPGTKMELAIFDITGREVYRYTATAGDTYNRSVVQAGKVSSGVYIIKFAIGDKRLEQKLVIQ